MARTPRTFGEVVTQRIERSRADEAKSDAIRAERERIEAILRDNPEIGVLIRKGKPVYYVNQPVYREHRDPAALVSEVV